MARRFERRDHCRSRVCLTAMVRRGRDNNPVILRVVNLGPSGARCRTRTPFRLGASVLTEFFLEGKGIAEHPRVLSVYCRVVWTASVQGTSCPVQELGLAFPELDADQKIHLDSLLREAQAA